MKYILLIPLLLLASATHAAYWVVDENVPARGSIKDLSDSVVVSMESYLYAKVPDYVFVAKENKVCVKKYEKLTDALLKFDKGNKGKFSEEKFILAREKIISTQSKNIYVCLKKEGVSTSSKSKETPELKDLENRIIILEKQVEDIIKALQSLGKMNPS